MAILNNNPLIGSGGQQGYSINNSLRFRRSASASLTRTPSSATNRKTWTWSGWVKRGLLSSTTLFDIYYANNSTALFDRMYFHNSNGTFELNGENGVSVVYNLVTTQVFRDPSAWYHIVVAFDTTQATASNRIKIYVNGNQVTAFSTSTYPSLNFDTQVNNNVTQYIGTGGGGASDQLFDGYMAEVNFIDGSAKTPSDFGETDTTTGVWKPKSYTGTYGTNGFYLKFSDIATTSGSNAGLGKDFSGNSNYWTTNNISVTSGSTYDAMLDVPTNTSATVANYCVLNPLGKRRTVTQVATFSEANLKATFPNAAGNSTFAIGTFGVTSGKWYWEIPVVTRATELVIGIGNTGTLDETNGGAGYQATNGAISGFTTNPPAGASYTSGDIIGVALDVDAGTCAFYKNNSLQGTGTGLLSTPQPWVQGNTNDVINANFGQRPFSYTPPTGFVALNTFNLPTPTILQGNKYMDATLYTGTGSSLSVTNASAFKPDFVWVKSRSAATDHALYDSVRGVQKQIESNNANAETTETTGLTAFNSNGFTVSTLAQLNTSAATYVGWQWQAGQGSTSSNTSGTITSTVSVNATAGFSIVTYTGTGANATVGHGLGVAPKMIIVKDRTTATNNFQVYHESIGNTTCLRLNLTNASAAANAVFWNNTSPTSSVFSLGTYVDGNQSGDSFVGYCWAEIAGFSKFTSYTGNGSSDGPFIYLGFRPKFIMIKSSAGVADDWSITDTSRSTYNLSAARLSPNRDIAEDTNVGVGRVNLDILSNGFKLRESSDIANGNGFTYIVAAWAENPFKNSLAR